MAKTIKIGGRLESVETGNIVAGANQIIDDAKNKKQSVINGEVDAELVRLDETKQNNLTFDNAPTEDSINPVKSGGVYAADALLQQAIEAILLLIPSAASALNKLVDEQKMNSSISTNTATFRGTYNSVVDLHLAVDATHQQIADALDGIITTADNNDYAYVQIPVSAQTYDIRRTERYKYNGTAWAFEYELNTSGFTADQWAAINSGVNATIVGEIGDIQNVIPSEATIANKLTDKASVDALIEAITELIPSEASTSNQLADKAYVIATILAAIPAFKGTYETLAGLEDVQSPKDGDIGIVLTMADDGLLTYGFYQYLNNDWNPYYTLSQRPKDKPATTGTTGDYPYNGMGRVVLQKNMVSNVNTLTQDMFYKGEVGSRVPNEKTIFVIQYDFVLGENITIPSGCVLEFNGGSISGAYTITGANTVIKAGLVKIFDTSITLAGTWKVAVAYPEWFGAVGDGVNNDRVASNKVFLIGADTVMFSSGRIYNMGTDSVEIKSNTHVIVDGTIYRGHFQFFVYDGNAPAYSGVHDVVVSGHGGFDMGNSAGSVTYNGTCLRIAHCSNIQIQGLFFKNNGTYHCIEIGGSKNVTIKDCTFKGGYHASGQTSLGECIQIEHIAETGTTGATPYDATTCKDITIDSCKFVPEGDAYINVCIGIHDSDLTLDQFENIDIRNCTAKDSVFFYDSKGNVKNMSMLGNYLYNLLDRAFQTYGKCENVVIKDNIFDRLQKTVISFNTDGTTNNFEDIQVLNNIIIKCGRNVPNNTRPLVQFVDSGYYKDLCIGNNLVVCLPSGGTSYIFHIPTGVMTNQETSAIAYGNIIKGVNRVPDPTRPKKEIDQINGNDGVDYFNIFEVDHAYQYPQ